MSTERLEWFGGPGHFCASYSCRYHLHTHVNGRFCVSTVGAYHPRDAAKMETVGCDRYYETMVFPLTDDGGVDDWSGLTMRGYQTSEEADVGHLAVVVEYQEKAK